ncbi:hypothetical protein BH11PSE9_BH11PSE9_25070 [soil metagenome]
MAERPAAFEASALAVRPSRWRSDLWWVVAATVGCYLIASAFELQASITHRLQRFASWQADEMPLSLTVLACGLAWYALRRRREIQAQLQLREQAEARIADLLAHKRELAQQLISLQESERLALARELHDELGQSCTAIRVETAYLSNLCRASVASAASASASASPGDDSADRAAMLASAARADEAALGLYRLVRDMLSRLRPAHLDSLGLAAALQELCESWETRTAVRCSLQVEGDVEALGDTLDITIYRVVQEALTNVARHAQARSVRVTLTRESAASLSLRVQDDGRGMDTARATHGLGLIGAVERAAAVGGELEVVSAPGQGVAILLRVPVMVAHVNVARIEPNADRTEPVLAFALSLSKGVPAPSTQKEPA